MTVDATPDTLLRSTLAQVRLEGAIFFRSEFTDAFSFESAPLELADALHPGADRLILFHIVATGSCWVEVEPGVRHWADEGDVIVLPYADHYVMGGSTPTEPMSILGMLEPLPWDEIPVVHHGGGGARTDLVCGYLHSVHPLFDPTLRALPSVFVVRLPPGPASHWVAASVSYAVEQGIPSNRSTSLVATRLPELVLMEVLRVHLSTAPTAGGGWMAALSDPVLAPALALMHGSPDQAWTVASLASHVAVSRSLLDARFRQVLGRSPIRYLTEWRMHVAEELLSTTRMPVVAVARRVGYVSEEAFSRAFKRERGCSPSHWRTARRAGTEA